MTAGVPPYALVRQHFEFPPKVEDRDFQIEHINAQAPLPRFGLYWEVGTGKTFALTCIILYKKLVSSVPLQAVVLMPPILTTQWRRWIESITDRRTGRRLTAVEYKGAPNVRKQLNLNADFLLMSTQIFKKDYEYLTSVFEHRTLVVGVDEATSIKNTETDNHRKVRDFAVGRDLGLLTGTPLSKPMDAYAYIKLISPTVYRSLRHFEALHVAKRDFFGNVVEWANLEMLRENLMLNSSRVLKEQAQPYLKKPIYDQVPYRLDPKHQKLYDTLAEEQLLILEDGGKIDATQANRLYTMLQQIICNPGHFSGDPNMHSAAHEILDTMLDDISADTVGGQKLIVYALFNMTHDGLATYLEPYGAVSCYGKVPMKRQIENLERFKHDPACRVAALHPESAGVGVDGLQGVCSNVLFMELPTAQRPFTQGVGRVYRDGQDVRPLIRMPMAERTIQVRLKNQLLANDALVNKVQGGFKDLRDAIYGDQELEAA